MLQPSNFSQSSCKFTPGNDALDNSDSMQKLPPAPTNPHPPTHTEAQAHWSLFELVIWLFFIKWP